MSKEPFAVAGHGYLHRSDIGQDGLGAFAVAGVVTVLAGRVVLGIAEVVGDLALQGGLQQPLRQRLQQPTLAGQLQTLGLGPAHQLVDQLVVHSLCRTASTGAWDPDRFSLVMEPHQADRRSETARGEFTLPMQTGVLRVRRL
ncbi:hypothetical protein QF035_010224 [Streptomyces umbrinus]|uniref:Uncharacterized protein n=1 Tax=Streptomyces umbrinus TaxID=67370 RepID=A0ABU0TA07_9ACTN|nr:hypothetical protein [Streptomyces umbrinus]